jgi:hypothetical protein
MKKEDKIIMRLRQECSELIAKHGIPHVGRWVYCKYCYKNVCPVRDSWENLVTCGECGYGLAHYSDVIKAGSYEAMENERIVKYSERIKEETRKALN